MKKILLSAVALLATMSVNAQEVGQISTEDLVSRIGLTTDKNDEGKSIKNDVAAGTVFCETASVTMSAAFDDSYSPENAASPKIDDANYGTIKIGDLTLDATQAVQGNSNPKDEAGTNPALASTVPVSPAAVFEFEAKTDGFLYVFHKATSAKNYMVYENKAPMGYIFTMATDGSKALPKVFGYELKGEGEFNYLPEGTEVKTPEKIFLGDDAEEVKINGLSVIKFPVFVGCKYWVCATGSKMTSCGFYFDTTGDATITIENGVSEALTILDKGQVPGAEPAPTFDVWTIAGGSNLMGSNWDTTDTTNDMKTTDGVEYKLVKEGVVLEQGVTYEFKAAKDHAWTEAYPSENATLSVAETATYTVTFIFNAELNDVTVTVEKTGEAEIGEKTYSVIGTINGSWDTDTDMEKGADGIYTAVFENVAAGEYKFKVRVNHDWGENYGNGDDGDGNTVINVENDGSTVTVTFNPENQELKCVIAGGAVEPAGDVVVWENDGAKGAISWSSDYRFANEEKKTGEEIAAIPMDIWAKMKSEPFFVDLEGENPQIRVTTGWWDTNLTADDIQPGNELLTDNGGGKWTLKVDLTTAQALLDLVDDHHLLFTGDRYTPTKIYFAGSTAINSVKKAAQNDGAIYNVAGQKVSASYKGLVIKNGKKYIQK